jgi:uncharacterized protein YerC
MTNVSKRELEPEVRKKLLTQFAGLFKAAGDVQLSKIFSELFTEAEQIMFVKRLAIIIMLINNFSNYAIAQHLEVSEATVRSTKAKYVNGEYDTIVRVLNNKKFDGQKFWRVLELVLTAGLPPRTGRGRWKFVFNHK